jgi:hypothetical protein
MTTSKPSNGDDADQLKAFGITVGPARVSSLRTGAQPDDGITPLPSFETRVQTASPVSPPPGFGGLWGDLDTAPSLPDVRMRRETNGAVVRRVSAPKLRLEKVKGLVSKVRSVGPSPAASPPYTPVEPPRHYPRTKEELLTSFVFPTLRPPITITGVYGPDAVAAIWQLDDRTLQVQHHAGLVPLLLRQLEMLRGIPDVPRAGSQGGFNQANAIAAEEYACSLDTWMRAERHMTELAGKTLASDMEIAETWCSYLGQAVNNLLEDPDTFRPGFAPDNRCQWQLPDFMDAQHRYHDWVAYCSREDKPDRAVAMLSWRMEACAADFESVYAATMSEVHPNWMLDVHHPGFELDVRRKRLMRPAGLSFEASMLALLAWHGMHHYKVRWAIVFNGDTAIVTYLCKQHTLFVSKPFACDRAGGLTLASALFALAAMDHRSDANRPLYTMRNDSMGYFPRPDMGLVANRWAKLCSECSWARYDDKVYREHERTIKHHPPDFKLEGAIKGEP